jgi:hypothetical protein
MMEANTEVEHGLVCTLTKQGVFCGELGAFA